MTDFARIFQSRIAGCLTLMLAVLAPVYGHCETKLDVRLDTAAYVIDNFQAIPERNIPPTLLNGAAAIAIVPNVLKVGFGVGARFGRGVLLVRGENGKFRAPVFITLGSGSFGWQIGAQAADLVLIFRNADKIGEITSSKFTLGADASVAAGPVGRYTSASTDLKLDAEVYSYSRTKGLFAGVALDGTVLGVDKRGDASYYVQPGITAAQIFAKDTATIPDSAKRLLRRVEPYTVSAVTKPDSGSAPPTDTEAAPVRTFGMGEQPVGDDG